MTNQAVIRKLGQYDAATNTYRTPERIVNMFTGEDGVVHVFQKTEGQVGFVRTMPMLEYLKQYNLEAYRALERSLPPEIWAAILGGG